MTAGTSRHELALSLKSAYAEGRLSEDTFVRRLDWLMTARLVDPLRLLGDLGARRPVGRVLRRVPRLADVVRRLRARDREDGAPTLLALDWTGAETELTIGRHYACDIVLSNQTVSRHHACLVYRDGVWVLHDLESTNGTTVNGAPVGHCILHPGDDLVLGDERLTVD